MYFAANFMVYNDNFCCLWYFFKFFFFVFFRELITCFRLGCGSLSSLRFNNFIVNATTNECAISMKYLDYAYKEDY